MKLDDKWKSLTIAKRGEIIDAWQDTFVMFAIMLLVGGALLNWTYELPTIVCLCADIMGIVNLLMTGALGIWRKVFIMWGIGDEDR